MIGTLFLDLLLQSIFKLLQVVGYELDEATREHVQQCVEYLTEKTWKQRLQGSQEDSSQQQSSLVQSSPEQSGFAWGAPLSSASQQWQFWAVVGVLVLLCWSMFCWWLGKRSSRTASSSKEGSSRNKIDKKDQEENPSLALQVCTMSFQRLLNRSDSFTTVKDLVDDLLYVCHRLARNSFMPQLKPVVRLDSVLRGWGPHEGDAVYCLIVPLKPPHGHVFHLELGTTEEMPAKYSCIRVELECSCIRGRLLKDTPCFLHFSKEKLRANWGPSLLDTLCTGPYLNIEKTARWFQGLVKHAWSVLPQSRRCQLTVLPSRRSCKLQLTGASNRTILIHIMFGMKEGDSYTFLGIE